MTEDLISVIPTRSGKIVSIVLLLKVGRLGGGDEQGAGEGEDINVDYISITTGTARILKSTYKVKPLSELYV